MVTGQVLMLALAFTGLWYAGRNTVTAIKKLDQSIAHKIHPNKFVAPKDQKDVK
jgi:hypothetical protein